MPFSFDPPTRETAPTGVIFAGCGKSLASVVTTMNIFATPVSLFFIISPRLIAELSNTIKSVNQAHRSGEGADFMGAAGDGAGLGVDENHAGDFQIALRNPQKTVFIDQQFGKKSAGTGIEFF